MAADRPLLFPSPVSTITPSSQDDVHESSSTVDASDDLSKPTDPKPTDLKPFSLPWMQHSSTNPRILDRISNIPIPFKSFSQRTSASIQPNPISSLSHSTSVPSSIQSKSIMSKRVIRYGSSGRADSIEGLSGSMSRREFDDQDSRFVRIGDPGKTDDGFQFARNSIRTGKYSIFTFLPRNLFEQFHRVAYIYFLAIAVMNQLPQLAVFGRGVSILPLAFVLLVTAVKDAYEDWRRHRADRIENNRLASVLAVKSSSEFRDQKWRDIRVGDILRISADQTIPCDMVLLSTADPTGVAYVQTLNLDGESNLKTRYAKKETLSSKMMSSSEIIGIGGLIRCEKPNRNIYGFLANMEIRGKRLSLGPTNVVLRGCQLKNTAWMIGVAVYCGGETKAMLNSSGAPSKRSRLETIMNRQIVLLSLFLSILCTVVSICAAVWLRRHRDELDTLPYYRRRDFSKTNDPDADYSYYGWGLEIFFTFLMSVIVFQIMIPISLYISMELVRVGQAYFMIRDNRLFDEASGSRFQCRALNINEDLGQIQYLFSDKTGTLTENKMEFQCASIGGVDYSSHGKATDIVQEVEEDGHSQQVVILRPKIKVKTDPKLLQLAANAKQGAEGKHVYDFFLALAACNTIVPLISSIHSTTTGSIDYQGESPDEQALVYAAAAYGFVLVERASGHLIIDVQGERQRFNVLGLHEFDSERKRMSVILGCPDKTIRLFIKGADSTMFSVSDDANNSIIHSTQAHLHAYSSLGLRTLVIGMRELSPSDFEQWHHCYEEANSAISGRGGLIRKVASNLEKNVTILGTSGIEDKLQEGVPEAIKSLRRAGIRVWVLTGDKQETAISIGYSSKLLTRKMTQIIINCKSMESCKKSLEDGLVLSKKLKTMSIGASSEFVDTQIALIVDGTSLVYILDSEFAGQLFELARRCSVVLCCRVAPLQKAGIVALVKRRTDEMTLAIGDGANDVSMIQMADVGIGISGQEGRQAVMASDFAIGQFRFLIPLLLVHGHWNYQRIAYMILYNFYRNAVLVLVLFWYVLFTRFSLTTAITDWSSVLYSVIYTSVPTIVVGILDKDVSRRVLLWHPQLYGVGQRGESYNSRLFWACMADTVWQSMVIFFVPLFAYRESTVDVSSLGDLWVIGVVILANLHLAMDVMRWMWITHAAIWGSIIATFVCVVIIDVIPILVGYWAIFEIAKKGVFWLCLLGMIVGGMLPRFAVKVFCEFWCPRDIQIAREAQKFGGNGRLLGIAETEMNPLS